MPDHETKNTVGLAVKQAEYLESRIKILEKCVAEEQELKYNAYKRISELRKLLEETK
jgi:hypothetical protein